jgi:hypothetical protein
VAVVAEDFALVSKASANALPFKGVDASVGGQASVNSVTSQVADLHDFSDPEWLRIEGLVDEPTVSTLTIRLTENDAFIPGGTTREPVPLGSSPGWALPPWEFEHLELNMSLRLAETISAHCDSYELGTGAEAFRGCIDVDGWVELQTFADIGAPPPPAYLWDLLLEVAQVRLHDGGLSEGEADASITLTDVPIGVPPEQLVEQARRNIEANPEALTEFSKLITDSTVGDADFYYYRPRRTDAEPEPGDWLYFVTEQDIRRDGEGQSVRPYAYRVPGFFADPALQSRVSTLEAVDGDTSHQKVRIEPGDVLYFEDDLQRVFEIRVLDKPSRARVALELTRTR